MTKTRKESDAILPGREFLSAKGTYRVVRLDRRGSALLRNPDDSEGWVRVSVLGAMIARGDLKPCQEETRNDARTRPERDPADRTAAAVDPGGSDAPQMGTREGQLAFGF